MSELSEMGELVFSYEFREVLFNIQRDVIHKMLTSEQIAEYNKQVNTKVAGHFSIENYPNMTMEEYLEVYNLCLISYLSKNPRTGIDVEMKSNVTRNPTQETP